MPTLLVAGALAASSGCSGVEGGTVAGEAGYDGNATGQAHQPIVGGETDRERVAVLAIATITPEAEGLCTGTLIAPNLVLTARHCVVPIEDEVVDCNASSFPSPFAPEALWVSPSTSVRGADLFPVREVAVPEDDGALCGADIALLILNGQFTDRIVPITPRLDTPAAPGEAFTAVGFGTALEEGAPGIRRALSDLQVVCGAEQCGAPEVLTSTEFLGEQGVCEGDSGGPALDVEGRVLGVASRTGLDCTWAIYSAVSPWRSWILDVADRAFALGDYEPPRWLADANDDAIASNDGLAADDLEDVLSPEIEAPTAEAEPPREPEPELDEALEEMAAAVPSGGRESSGCAIRGPTHAGTSETALQALGWVAAAVLGRRLRRRADRS